MGDDSRTTSDVDVVDSTKPDTVFSSLTDLSLANTRTPYEEIQHLKQLSWVLDSSIPIPKTNQRFGIEVLIGLLPIGGDVISTGYSTYIIYKGYQTGASLPVLLLMVGNVVADSVVSLVPGIGTIIDAFWKCNNRNVALLEQYHQGERIKPRQVLTTMVAASLPVLVFIALFIAAVGAIGLLPG